MPEYTFFAPGTEVAFRRSGESHPRLVINKDGELLVGAGSAAPAGGSLDAQAWTPAITSSSGTAFVLGTTGTAEGRYVRIGDLVWAHANIKLGSAGSGLDVGANQYHFSLPVTPRDPTNTEFVIGSGQYYDDSAGDTWTTAVWVNTDQVARQTFTTTTVADRILGADKPVVPAESDRYSYVVVYEAA